MMKMVYILIRKVVMKESTFVKTHQTVPLKLMHFIECNSLIFKNITICL